MLINLSIKRKKKNESVLRPLSGSVTMEGELNARTHTTTLVTAPLSTSKCVALRTVPVYVTNGARRVKVNTLLDEASSKSYLNSDVAAELGLEGSPHELIVNVLNGSEPISIPSPVCCSRTCQTTNQNSP